MQHVAKLLLFCALAGPLAGAPVVSPPRKVALRLDWYPQAENGGFFCALVNGYYRKAGLDVDIISASSNSAVEPAVALGKSEFGLSNTDRVLLARSRGLPLVAVLATLEHDPTAVMVHAESSVKTFADLEGHAVAVPPGASWFPFLVRKYQYKRVREIPLTFENATFVHTPDYIEECLVTAEPYFMALNNIKVRTLLIMDAGCDPYRVLITSDSFLAREPQLVRAFVEASREGWRNYLADPAATDAEITRRNPEMTPGQLTFSRNALAAGHFIDGFAAKQEEVGLMTEQRFKAQYELLRSIGLLTHDFDFRPAFTTQFAPATEGSAKP